MGTSTKRIILMGLDFNSTNLGCSALAFSFLNLIASIAQDENLFLDLVSVNYSRYSCEGCNYILRDLPIHFKQKSFRTKFREEVAQADLVFDFTAGDSFTDIYGLSRFAKASTLKEYVLLKKKTLILGPQTIGPFNTLLSRQWAKHILRKAFLVYSRDALSFDYSKKSFGVTTKLSTDIAFMLPPDPMIFDKGEKTEKNIGVNVSGLLWHGGYTGKNELGISVEYHELIESFIEYLLNNHWNVYLVPHVLPKDDNSPENDYTPMVELKKKYPQLKLAPKFNTPMEAKGFISQMDFFVGSRMHATIGAFSMGVPTVSISYSRKFQGLYNSVNYPYVIDAKTNDTNQARKSLIEWLEKRDVLKTNVDLSLEKIHEMNSEFVKDIKKILLDERTS